jgi:N-acetylneuraminate synthase
VKSKKIYIIAEAGVNHNGSIELAKELVDAAAEAGADAVKFQTFKAERNISKKAPKADYQLRTTGTTESQLDMVKKLELDQNAHHQLFNRSKEKNIEFLSTPFDIESVDLLVHDLGVQRLKISSGEITNGPLLLKAAHSGKPLILSTGMSTLGDVETALGILAFGYLSNTQKPEAVAFREAYASENGRAVLKDKVILLHCTTEYPAPFNDINLRVIDTLRSAFDLPVGMSDHSTGIVVPIAAAALGAVVIEKHFTLDRSLPGPDQVASLEPSELRDMIEAIRQVESALGSPQKVTTPAESKNLMIARKSLTAACDISAGELFSEKNVTFKRPGNGISPVHYWEMIGTRANRDIKADEQL